MQYLGHTYAKKMDSLFKFEFQLNTDSFLVQISQYFKKYTYY